MTRVGKRWLRVAGLLWSFTACVGLPRSPGAGRGVMVPAGAFLMGCETNDSRCETQEFPRHPVRLTQAFGLDRTEITVSDFRAFTLATGYRSAAEREGRGRMWDADSSAWRWIDGLSYQRPLRPEEAASGEWPAVQLAYRDAEAYCRWRGGRLPTEAEWEYAARGAGRDDASLRTPPAGNGPDEQLHRRIPSWDYIAGRDDGFGELAPVGRFPPNRLGLHDMIGNAYEWTSDSYIDAGHAASDSVDPIGRATVPARAVRGGSWGYYPWHHRASWRGVFESDGFRTATLGGRCAYDLTDPPMHWPLWRNARPGPHRVGFATRILQPATVPRQVRVSLWYPAQRAAGTHRVPFGAYSALFGGRPWTGVDTLQPPRVDSTIVLAYRAGWFPSAPIERVAHLAATPTAAHWRAPMARGRWPVVLYATGLGGTPLTHTVTAEYLASQGYVVAMVPALARDGSEQPYDTAGQAALQADLEAVYESLTRCSACDLTRVATVGFSFGANVAMLLAQRLPNVRGVVSLDGSLTFHDGHPILSAATAFQPSRATQPLLAVTAANATDADLALLRRLPAQPAWHLSLRGIEHHDVIASPVIASVVTDSLSPTSDAAYQVTLQTLRAFLRSLFAAGPEVSAGDLSAPVGQGAGFATMRRLR